MIEEIKKIIEELQEKRATLKNEEIPIKNNIEKLNAEIYLEERKIIQISQDVDNINKKIEKYNTVLETLAELNLN